MEQMILIWIVILIAALIIEIITTGALVSVWFCFGAGAALIAAWFAAPLWSQILLFTMVSVMSLIFTRPFILKYIHPKEQPTNADRILGEVGIVIEKVDNLTGCGYIEIKGRKWRAQSLESEIIDVGEKIKVIRIEGVKAIVVKI